MVNTTLDEPGKPRDRLMRRRLRAHEVRSSSVRRFSLYNFISCFVLGLLFFLAHESYVAHCLLIPSKELPNRGKIAGLALSLWEQQ